MRISKTARKRLLLAFLIPIASILGLAGGCSMILRWQECYGEPFALAIERMPLPPSVEIEWTSPRWTPDGNRVMFGVTMIRDTGYWHTVNTVVGSLETRAYTASIDGARLSPLDNADMVYKSVSPNGLFIAYPDDGGVSVSSPDGSERRRFAVGRGYAFSPTWSPDSERIAFERKGSSECSLFFFTATPDRGLYTMNRDGSKVRAAARSGMTLNGKEAAYNRGWAWSPDSRSIAFAGVQPSDAERDSQIESFIYAVNPDGSDLTRLFTALSDNEDGKIRSLPTWSLDGERIAFLTGGEKDKKLHLMNRDGRGLSEGVNIPARGRGGSLSWHPVDASLLLASIGYNSYIVNIDESSVLTISGARHVAWSPDGSKVAAVVDTGDWMWFNTDLKTLRLSFPPDAGEGDAGVFVMSPDGSDSRLLAILGKDGTVRAGGQLE